MLDWDDAIHQKTTPTMQYGTKYFVVGSKYEADVNISLWGIELDGQTEEFVL